MGKTEKLKDKLIAFVNSREAATKKDVKEFLETYYQTRGLKPYDGSLLSGWEKGHWHTENRVTIYKAECPRLPDNRLRIYLSVYGIGNKRMFYGIGGIELNSMTREEEVRAKIWKDINNGIVGKTYN